MLVIDLTSMAMEVTPRRDDDDDDGYQYILVSLREHHCQTSCRDDDDDGGGYIVVSLREHHCHASCRSNYFKNSGRVSCGV